MKGVKNGFLSKSALLEMAKPEAHRIIQRLRREADQMAKVFGEPETHTPSPHKSERALGAALKKTYKARTNHKPKHTKAIRSRTAEKKTVDYMEEAIVQRGPLPYRELMMTMQEMGWESNSKNPISVVHQAARANHQFTVRGDVTHRTVGLKRLEQ